jgi:hypothetical protein
MWYWLIGFFAYAGLMLLLLFNIRHPSEFTDGEEDELDEHEKAFFADE